MNRTILTFKASPPPLSVSEGGGYNLLNSVTHVQALTELVTEPLDGYEEVAKADSKYPVNCPVD